jgi:hypothetical protein
LARVAAVALVAAACQGVDPIDDMDAALRDAGGRDGAEEVDRPVRDGGGPDAEVGPDGPAQDGGGVVDGAVVDVATVSDGPAGTSTAPMACAGTVVLPSFDRSCTDERDCVAVTHQISCCGSKVALGLNKKELEAFTRAETMCAASYPACGCPALPTRTDDGSSTPGLAGDVVVACREGTCSTFVKGCGGPCGAGTSAPVAQSGRPSTASARRPGAGGMATALTQPDPPASKPALPASARRPGWPVLYRERQRAWHSCDAAGLAIHAEAALKHGVYRMCKKAGLRERSWHSARHTFATHAARFGVNPWRLQAWLGHSTIAMTMRYVHRAVRANAHVLRRCRRDGRSHGSRRTAKAMTRSFATATYVTDRWSFDWLWPA